MTIKKILSLLICLISLKNFAYDHSYDVYGEDENGNELSGEIYSNNGDKAVSGELEDDYGNTIEFNGEWDGEGHISGETEDGVSVELDTN